MKTLNLSALLTLFLFFALNAEAQELKFYQDDGITLIPEEGTNFPEPDSYTHFGNVNYGNTRSIIIVVKVEEDLRVPFSEPELYQSYDASGNPGDLYTGNDFVISDLTPKPKPPLIPKGSEFSFIVTFQPQTDGVKDIIIDLKLSADSDHHFFNMRGIGQASAIEVVYQNNGKAVVQNSPSSSEDGTDFGTLVVGSSKKSEFLIQNEGSLPLTINQWNLTGSPNFQLLNTGNNTVAPGESKTFEVEYAPNNANNHHATLTILNNDPDEGLFIMNFTGKGVVVPGDFGKLMITQTFENGNNDFVEIKNISGQIVSGTFYLARFSNNTNNPVVAPVDIGTFQVGQIKSIPFLFSGSDVLVISTSNGKNCFTDRIEMVGSIGQNWGQGKSLIKSDCASTDPHLDFSLADWQELSLVEVNSARNDQNLKLGIHFSGESIYENGWTNGFPDRTRTVRISGDYNEPAPFKSCDLIVDANLNFDHNSDQSLEVFGDLTVSNGQFTIGDTESLMMYNDYASISGSVNKIEKTTSLQRIYDATYWSSPVHNADLQTIFSGVNQNRIFLLDPSKKNQIYLNTAYEHWFVAKGNMGIGRGYSIDGKQIGINTFRFSGKPNNGKISTQVFFNYGTGAASNDFNLVGNPYPSAIDPIKLIQANSDVFDGAIYLWTHQIDADQGGNFSSNDYIVYNLAGSQYNSVPTPFYISSGQGFMVNTIKSGHLFFDNSMRVVGNNQYFYKQELSKHSLAEKDRVWLKIIDQNKLKKETLIGFFEEATSAYDYGYDAKLYPGEGLRIFSIAGNDHLSIQSVEKEFDDKEIRIGFSTGEEQDLQIGLSRFEGNLKSTDIYLIDHQLNAEHNLKIGDYKFRQSETGSILDRFSLKFRTTAALGIDEPISEENLISINQKSEVVELESFHVIQRVQLFDMMGRKLGEFNGTEKSFQLATKSYKTGTVLFLNIYLENGREIKKKLIIYN